MTLYQRSILTGLILSGAVLANTAFAALPTYTVTFGYNVSNTVIQANTPIKNISFDYGSIFSLPAWGSITSSNATLASTALGNGMTHYTVTIKPGIKITAAQFNQVPLLTSSPPAKNMSFSDYYGLLQHLKINGTPAQYQQSGEQIQTKNPLPKMILGAYYADWSVYNAAYSPTLIPFKQLNTLYYAFGSLNPATGEANMFDPWADAGMTHVNALPYIALQKHFHPYLSLIYSFGGWGAPSLGNYQSGDMSILFSYYPHKIQNFADTMIAAITKMGFNGIDIDYEWNAPQNPTPPGGYPPLTTQLTQAEADGYATLMVDLHHEKNVPANFTLTIALPVGIDKIKSLANFKYQGSIASLKGQSDLKIITDNTDHINLMTYDFHGAFDAGQKPPQNISDFQAAIATASTDPNASDPIYSQYSLQGATNALETYDPSIKASQMIIGVPAYGRVEQIGSNKPVTPFNRGLFLTLNSDQSAAAGELGNSVINYRCLMNPITGCMNNYTLPSDLIKVLAINKADPVSKAVQTAWAYTVDKNQFMSFDSAATAKNKGVWIKEHHFGGAMVWELDGDLWMNDANYTQDSIVTNLGLGLSK